MLRYCPTLLWKGGGDIMEHPVLNVWKNQWNLLRNTQRINERRNIACSTPMFTLMLTYLLGLRCNCNENYRQEVIDVYSNIYFELLKIFI